MKGDTRMIELLNAALKKELTAINQYFLHARIFDHWGLRKLGKHEYEESIDEMKHADWLIARILFLDGLPNLQDLGRLKIGETTKEIIECDLSIELEAHPLYAEGIAYAESIKDYVTRELLVKIQQSEEHHIDYLEEQLKLIELIGEANYNQSHMWPGHTAAEGAGPDVK